jgi:hypothetical protein
MIDKIERMNLNQENPKEDPETKAITEPQKESEKVLLQMKETLNNHRHVIYQRPSKEKNASKQG